MKNLPHLHLHSCHSMLDGVPTPTKYIKACEEKEIPAIAFTEHGNMSSHAEASVEGQKSEVNVILGFEAYIVSNVKRMNELRKEIEHESDETRKDLLKEALTKFRSSYHATLLATNADGYRNLIHINNASWTDGFYYRNRTDPSQLGRYSSGVCCLSGCMSGVIGKHILNKKPKKALKWARRMHGIYGDKFFIEIQFLDDIPEQDQLNPYLINISKKLKIPMVITNDVHYLNKGDHKLQQILLHLASKGSFVFESKSNFLKTRKDFLENVKSRTYMSNKLFEELAENTQMVADMCDYHIETGNIYFPSFDHTTHFMFKDVPEFDKEKFFKKMMIKRAVNVLGPLLQSPVYKERLINEFKTLCDLGAIDYFLIVDDLLHYIRSQGAFSVIRGSANGSLIAYVLEFGLIDPVRHGVLFERFISKHRSLNDVDIDIDVRSEFRQKAIVYLKQRYGKDRVLSVGTYNRMQLKGAIKDVTRVFKERLDVKIKNAKTEKEASRLEDRQEQFLFPMINRITSEMTGDLNVEQALVFYDKFADWHNNNKKIFKRYIEPVIGNIKNVSLHPAGIVITPGPASEYLPIRTQANPHNSDQRAVATVWENSHTGREDLNEFNFMALDVLGVKTLSVVSETLKLVKKNCKKDIDLRILKLDDKKTLATFNKNETIGVFQFSGGASRSVIEITPITDFNDLIVITAIARPGALGAGADRDYAARKKDPSLVEYDHHSLEEVLGDSLGVLTFSEHIIRTASEFAGMPLKEADNLRKIIKGKNPAVFKAYRKQFIRGAKKKWSKEPDIGDVAKEIWKKFKQAGNYLFPRGHAASYAYLGYICQYLKVHYPAEFFTCHLRYAIHSKYATVKRIAERDYGVKFIMPNINSPKIQFEANKGKGRAIHWPLTAIKSVGEKAVADIVSKAPFSSFEDFFDRANKRMCNKRVVEAIIISGAMRDFGNKRAVALKYLDLRKDKKKVLPKAFDSKEAMMGALEDLYGFEMEALEELYKKQLKKFKGIITHGEFMALDENDQAIIFGKISRVHKIKTKAGDPMAFVKLKSGKEEISITLFPEAFEAVGERFKVGLVMVVSGKKNIYRNEHSVVVNGGRGHFSPGSWAREL